MGTINPRPRGGRSLRGELRAATADRQQIRRLLSSPPKPAPKPAAASGPGVIGTTEAFSDTFTQDDRTIEFTSWTFTPHAFWPGGGGPPMVEVSPGNALFDPVEPGWYAAHAALRLFVSGPVPPFVTVELNGQSTTNRDATTVERFELIPDAPYSGTLVRRLHTGNFYHPGPGVSNHFLGLLVGFPSTPGMVVSSANVYYILDRVF